MKKYSLLIMALAVLGPSVRAELNHSSTKQLKTKKKATIKNASTSVLLKYQSTGAKIQHNERSSFAGFTSLDEKTDISISNISLVLGQEFFAQDRFSFTLAARVGMSRGSDQGLKESTNLSYEDEVSGKLYGVGGSLNLNTSGFGLRIQPFIASCYITNKNEYKLSYKVAGSTDDALNLNYDIDNTMAQHSIGVRFLNNEYNLMSYFSLDYLQELDSDTTISADQSGNQILGLSNTAAIDKSDFAISIGIGFIF